MKRVIKKKNTGGGVQPCKLREWKTEEVGGGDDTARLANEGAGSARNARRWRPAWTCNANGTHKKGDLVVADQFGPTRKPNGKGVRYHRGASGAAECIIFNPIADGTQGGCYKG